MKALKIVGQRRRATPQSKRETPALSGATGDLSSRVWLTADMGARYAAFDDCDHPEKAFRQWAERRMLPVRHRGDRARVYRRADIDAAIENPRHFLPASSAPPTVHSHGGRS